MPALRVSGRRSLRRLIRIPYIYIGDWLDRWYEELPWRRRISLGRRGEQIAARHLKRRGYQIVARNYRGGGAEVDLVAVEDETLVFVEVKTRNGTNFGTPAEAVDPRKQERIRRAARSYAARGHMDAIEQRFDVVAITRVGRDRRLELIKDAF